VSPDELNSTFSSPARVVVSVQPKGSTTFVFPGILRAAVVNVSSPWISKVPSFDIVPPLSANSKPAVAKVALASIVSVPPPLNSNLSAILTEAVVLLTAAL